MTTETTFKAKAPGIMALLMADFPFTESDAAAVVGNLGHECEGFTDFTEDKPVVPGSRGGFGWAQWTGPRRRAFEAYCKRNRLDPYSDKANYGWLFVELRGSENAAVNATRAASTLDGKVRAFEAAFLRSGIKNWPSRLRYAQWAVDAYSLSPVAVPAAPGLWNWFRGLIASKEGKMIDRLMNWFGVGNMGGAVRAVVSVIIGWLVTLGLPPELATGEVQGAVTVIALAVLSLVFRLVGKRA